MSLEPITLLDAELDRVRLFLKSAPDEARRAALDIAEEASVLRARKTLSRAQLYHALALSWEGEDAAAGLLEKAIDLARRQRLDADLPMALDRAADLALMHGRFDMAMRHWVECLEYAMEAQDTAMCVCGHLGVGKIYYALEDYEQAKSHHLRSAGYGLAFYDPTIYSAIYLCLATDYLRLGQIPSAFVALKIAHDALPEVQGYEAWHVELAVYYAEAHAAAGHAEEAQRWISQALALSRDAGPLFRWARALALLSHGTYLTRNGDPEDAIQSLHEALEFATAVNASWQTLQAHRLLYQLYKDGAQHELALLHHRALHQCQITLQQRAREQRLQRATQRRLHKLEQRMELEQARHENHHLMARVQTHEQTIQNLSSAAQTDPLTGAWNRRALEERLQTLHAEARGSQQAMSVLMIDLDHFKEINDRFTHLVGDKVLQQVVKLIGQTCRNNEFVARYGGEEFTLLLPGASLEAASHVAERVRHAVAAYDWRAIEAELHVTVSIGAAALRSDEPHQALLARADMALYAAKRAGRNRINA
ncbi:hypothetical protein JCM19000A_12080 [Silvimonas sp. JCM 19000]